jgi:uncharacterized damage-inducible protein DinB
VTGHLAFAEGIVQAAIFGEQHPVEHWGPIFGPGSEAVADASKYPPFAEVRAQFAKMRAANLQVLESQSEADLDLPTVWQPPRLEQIFKTRGTTFLALALHQMSHRGQVADARRAAGRERLFM